MKQLVFAFAFISLTAFGYGGPCPSGQSIKPYSCSYGLAKSDPFDKTCSDDPADCTQLANGTYQCTSTMQMDQLLCACDYKLESPITNGQSAYCNSFGAENVPNSAPRSCAPELSENAPPMEWEYQYPFRARAATKLKAVKAAYETCMENANTSCDLHCIDTTPNKAIACCPVEAAAPPFNSSGGANPGSYYSSGY